MGQTDETIELIRGSSVLDLTDLVQHHVIAFDGFGAPPIRRLSERGPLQDGDSDIGFRLDPRTIRLQVYLYGLTGAGLHQRREALLGVLRPGVSADPVKLRYTYPSGVVRQIDTHLSGGMTFNGGGRLRETMPEVIELRAADPTWYDPTITSVPFSASGGGSGFVFPLSTNFTFGGSTLAASTVITLDGNNAWKTYPIITITGPVVNCTILNTSTGEKLQFPATIGAGKVYTIDTRYGQKTVVDELGANKIAELSSDSNLATFHLEPGDNSISTSGTSTTSATGIAFQFNPRFLGV